MTALLTVVEQHRQHMWSGNYWIGGDVRNIPTDGRYWFRQCLKCGETTRWRTIKTYRKYTCPNCNRVEWMESVLETHRCAVCHQNVRYSDLYPPKIKPNLAAEKETFSKLANQRFLHSFNWKPQRLSASN